MKISEIIESRGHKIIANKLKDIEREKRFAKGELQIPTPQERKEQEKKKVKEGWGAEPAARRHEEQMAAVAKVLQKYQNDPELSKLANYMFQNNWGAASIEKELSGKGQYNLDWWNGRLAKAEKERGPQKDWTQMMVDKYLNK